VRAGSWAVAVIMALLTGVASRSVAAPSSSAVYHIVMPRRALGAGESETLRLEPPAPAGARVMFGIQDGARGFGFGGEYRAPYLILPGTPPIRVVATISGPNFRDATPEEQIVLTPGAFPGAEDCLGPGQSFSKVLPDIDFTQIDELPTVIHRVEPEYPQSDFVRGVKDVIPVQAVVCRSGHVIDAFGLASYRDTSDPEPIHHDPKLVEAAVAAVRQYVFSPAMSKGVAVACKVTVPIAFGE
jgi:hypothetical protein